MRIGILSDIHGNAVALDAVLEDLDRYAVDRTVCLGDAVQGGCQPLLVARRLSEIGCPVVMGNADAFVLDGTSLEEVSDDLARVRDWTVGELGEEGLEIVRVFEPTIEIDLGDAGMLLCFHGSPHSYNDILLPETPPSRVREALEGTEADVLCGGHTHIQWTFTMDDKTFFNPGSVGLPYNRLLPLERFHFSPVAEYAIVSASSDGIAIEFKHVPFDADAYARAAHAGGHPLADSEATRFTRP
jgi:putative phosphoesterase